MADGEFQLIDRYFSALGHLRPDTLLSVGDDATLLEVPANHELICVTASSALALDGSATGVASNLGQRLLAELPEGFQIRWLLLALTLERVADSYLSVFTEELDTWLKSHRIQLVGGDTTRGSSTAELQALATRPLPGGPA